MTRGFIAVIFCVVMVLTGCTGGTVSSSAPILTDRQKMILVDAGLPSDLTELEAHQVSAIISIEEMLRYLEARTEKTFIYLGYVPAGVLEDERLTCYEEGTPAGRAITVKRVFKDGQYEYSDDYEDVQYGLECARRLKDHFMEVYGLEDSYVFFRAALADRCGYAEIYLDKNKVSADEAEALAREVSQWAAGDMASSLFEERIYLMDAAVVRQMDEDSYEDMVNEAGFDVMVTAIRSKDGSVEILRSVDGGDKNDAA